MAKKRKSWMNAEELAQEEKVVSFHPRDMKTFYAWDGDVLVLNILGTPSSKKRYHRKTKRKPIKN